MTLAPPTVPSLSLSDIMHPMSPPLRERVPDSPVAETLQDHDIPQIRARALQMGLNTEGVDSTPRERELLDMVLRLTNPNQPSFDPTQLVHQADTISSLVHQRDYLTRRIEEERSRWESERDSWERTSEALIVQRNRKVNGPDSSELGKRYSNLEYANKALKHKLDHTQGRIHALEAELLKLKPHLLMQPFVPRPTSLAPQPPVAPPHATLIYSPIQTENASESTPSTQPQPMHAEPASPSKDVPAAENPQVPAAPAEGSQTPILQPPSLQALAQASTYFASLPFPSIQNVNAAISRRKRLAAQLKKTLHLIAATSSTTQSEKSVPVFPTPPPEARTVRNVSRPQRKSTRAKSKRIVQPELQVSDARAEHLLLAARRMGRERAGIVAGVISAERQRMDREQAERERELRREKERIERGKKNRGGGGYYRERPATRNSTATSSATPVKDERSRAGSSRYATAMAGYVNAAGPKSTAKGKGKSVTTPLDSLLNAARSMLDDGENENGAEPPGANISSASPGMMTRRRRAAHANEQAEASAPKRRRLSSATSHSPTRVRTALDVLADQAAVFSSSGAPRNKGKGKASVDDDLTSSIAPPAKRKRGRPPKNKPPLSPKLSRLISPGAGPSHQGGAQDAESTARAESGMNSRPATKWVQRGRLASSASLRAPPRQEDYMDSDEEEDEPTPENKRPFEPVIVPQSSTEAAPDTPDVDPALRPTAAANLRPAAVEVNIVSQNKEADVPEEPMVGANAASQSKSVTTLPLLEEVLDADADGESDPDVDMEPETPLR
ncbi:hypothetical protein C8R43DRAFT_955967 [Mycena crocata]|nr:hypothetical protein C8R43DRAFT_955967 [Mycena crocata]